MFIVEETFNEQNDRVYARSSKEPCELVLGIERGHYPASVMVWWGRVTSLHFCEKGIKTMARNYQWDMNEYDLQYEDQMVVGVVVFGWEGRGGNLSEINTRAVSGG